MGTPSAGLAVGVVHRAERLAWGAGGVSGLALCLAMSYISKPKPRNNLYTKNMLIGYCITENISCQYEFKITP